MTDLTLNDVDNSLRMADPNADLDTASRALYASLVFGAGDEEKIAALGIDEADLRKVGNRYRMYQIWDAGGVDPGAENDVTFWMMTAIGQGRMTREFSDEKGEWMYALTAAEARRISKLLES